MTIDATMELMAATQARMCCRRQHATVSMAATNTVSAMAPIAGVSTPKRMVASQIRGKAMMAVANP